MATLKWLVHSACHGLGYPTKDETNSVCHGESLKVPNGNNLGLSYNHKSEQSIFQMPLHYPRYTKSDYDTMEDWRLDLLLAQYGLCFQGNIDAKRNYAKGAFLWPDQC